ncbi:MAG: hypothetical protein ACRDOO_28845 [Actinomadura sp.]
MSVAAVTVGALAAMPTAAFASSNSTFVPCNAVSGVNGLRAAIAAANVATRPRTIVLASGCTYYLTDPFMATDSGLPAITGNVTLKAKDATIRRYPSPNTPFRIVNVSGSGRLNAEGITFAGGIAPAATPNGGGILVASGGTLQLVDSRVTQNTAANDGGGIFSAGGTVRLLKTIVNGNNSPGSGGGVAANGGNLTITGGTVAFNQSGSGGGIDLVGTASSRYSITSADVVHNTATVHGGGIRLFSGTLELRRSNVQFNTATTAGTSDGGGIENSGALTVFESLISRNRAGIAPVAGNLGGGLINRAGGTVLIRESTLTGNAAFDGAAVFNENGTVGSVTVIRSLITNNQPDNCQPSGSGCPA